VLVDGRQVRDKARKEYERVLHDLEKGRKELDQFEKLDLPSYQKWLNRNLGALLTRLREAQEELAEVRSILAEVEWLASEEDISLREAYRRVIWKREHPQPEQPEPDNRFDEKQQNGGATDDFMHRLEEEFARLFGSRAFNSDRESKAREPQPERDRVKELYRRLARRLHPDTQTDAHSRKLEWWHQVQAAYENGDVNQLEVILTLCEIEDNGTTANTSVSLLMRICRQYKSALRAIRKKLKNYRQEPAWDFANNKALPALLERSEQDLAFELRQITSTLGALRAQFAQWAGKPSASRARRTRRRYASDYSQAEPWF
jgi:hypothetical protein